MNAEGLLEHYARIADAPDAITKLRRFVLDFAVRGKLISQDAGDEPASKLLSKISIDAVRTGAERKDIDRNVRPGCGPFSLPKSWTWTTLGTIARYGSPAKVNSNTELHESTWVLDLEDIEKNTGRLLQRMDSLARPFQSSKTRFDTGDVLFGKLRPYLCKVLVATEPGVCTTEIVPITPAEGVSPRFLELVMRSPLTMSKVDQLMYGVKMPRLGTSDAKRLLFPLPPSEEQHRIVAKVDELMALCDQLEAARAQRDATRDRLAMVSLARLNTPDPDTFLADARFALDALPVLTTRPDQIKQLRQTILNLAVRGKLVPQDATDEPANELIVLTDIEISEFSKKHRITRNHPAPIEETPFTVPPSWCWSRICEIFNVITDGDHQSPPRADEGVAFLTIGNISAGSIDFAGCRLVPETYFRSLPPYRVPSRGDILYTVVGATYGRPVVVDTNRAFCVQRHIAILKPSAAMSTRYLFYLLASSLIYDQASQSATGAAQPTIALKPLRNFLAPIPPLNEQHRIVAKVDELMALCDQLEDSLATGESTRSRLLDALLHEALATAPPVNIEHPRAAVSGYVISRLASRRNFGRTAHMKHLYLAESRLGLKLGGRYMREAAGPLDTGIYELEKQAEAADWYTHRVETLPSGNEKVSYMPGKALKALAEEGVAVLGPAREEMDRLIDLMGGLKTEHVEIIATLFAAWNDALLDGETPDDDWIVKEVREHWHVSKQRFTPAELLKWLGWMRQNDVIPLGHLPRTIQQTAMEL